jgi:hypothetical protein
MTRPGELPPCPRYPDRRHRFNPHGEQVTLADDTGTEHGQGWGYECECGAALIEAPHIGPGYQLAAPLPEPGVIGPS